MIYFFEKLFGAHFIVLSSWGSLMLIYLQKQFTANLIKNHLVFLRKLLEIELEWTDFILKIIFLIFQEIQDPFRNLEYIGTHWKMVLIVGNMIWLVNKRNLLDLFYISSSLFFVKQFLNLDSVINSSAIQHLCVS